MSFSPEKQSVTKSKEEIAMHRFKCFNDKNTSIIVHAVSKEDALEKAEALTGIRYLYSSKLWG